MYICLPWYTSFCSDYTYVFRLVMNVFNDVAYQCKSIYWLQKLETSTIIYKSGRGAQDRDRITYVQRQSKKQLRPVVQRVDNSIQLVNRYAAEKCEQLTIGKFRDTWEVWRALKKLELLEATPRATLTHLLCSPNFPSASYLDERTTDVS